MNKRTTKLDRLIARHSVAKGEAIKTWTNKVLEEIDRTNSPAILQRNLNRWPIGTVWHEPIKLQLKALEDDAAAKRWLREDMKMIDGDKYRCTRCWEFKDRNDMVRLPTNHQDRESLCRICKVISEEIVVP